jgi:AcrR family transcriptional regulator
MLTSLVSEKKKRKRDLLLTAAFDLFVEKGPGSTAIDDIVRRAGVAKGTFYLYFRDRNEILKLLVAQKGALLLREAYELAKNRFPASLEDEIVYTIEEVLLREEKAPKLITLIYKNFSWDLLTQALSARSFDSDNPLERLAVARGRKEAERLVFMIVELVSSVAYNAIVLEEPEGIGAMRDSLLAAVRRLLAD